jgi:molybdopterin synthase catalytic subunit
MANPVCEVLLTQARLEQPIFKGDSRAGAVVEFWGVVRLDEEGHPIQGLEYEVHEAMAEHQLRLIGEEAIERFGLKMSIIHHRIGFVAAGEASLFVSVSAPHRAAAFQAGQWLVDELKKKVPIWKRPKFTAGQPAPANSNMAPRALSPQ